MTCTRSPKGPEAEGLVIVAIEPPAGLEGARSSGLYQGKARSTNIIAASIEGYVEALNAMLAEAHWAGAAESAGRGRRSAAGDPRPPRRARSLTPRTTARPGSTSSSGAVPPQV